MSEWYEPKKDDIELDMERKEVDIYVTQKTTGSIYVTLTFDQIEKIHRDIKGG